MSSKPITLLIAGAGGRGTGFGRFAIENPERAQVVGVAEPRDFYRNRVAETHRIRSENVFHDWKDAAKRERFADAVLICTQDAMHAEPAIAFAARGYHILLEKPMAPNAQDCRRIAEAIRQAKVIFAVGHVLRYTRYTHMLKEIVDSGRIGEVLSMQHLEPVGYWHIAHSFVRGNWRNEAESSFMLLAKSCHDLDWMRHIMGVPCRRVSSFGSRSHFRPECAPEGAAARCLDCAVEADCPYSARRIYLGRIERGDRGWPTSVITTDMTREGVEEALRTGPYGRCVYACDNDVVDHQVVSMEFEGGRTAVFSMNGFNKMADRKTRLFGARGEINGDGRVIEVFDFVTEKTETIDTRVAEGSILGGHGGGDWGLMDCFVRAVSENDASHLRATPEETLETHLCVFAAEQARREGRVVDVPVC